jgi:hypothetical protein
MDVERTMEFILEQQAKNQETLASLLTAQAGSDRRIDRLEKLLSQLARLGVNSRSKINRRADAHEANFQRIEQNLAEATEKLNALIAFVDRWPRNAS